MTRSRVLSSAPPIAISRPGWVRWGEGRISMESISVANGMPARCYAPLSGGNLMRLASRLLAVFLVAAASPAVGGLHAGRLDGVTLERLPNGLTVMVLEDPTLPIVSTQVLYKVGGRTECPGSTGLAHFVEHMA